MTEIEVSNAPVRTHGEVISFYLDLSGKDVLDIGCGDGRLTRTMTEMGATVIGIEPGERQLARARAAATIGSESYVEGAAEEHETIYRTDVSFVDFESFRENSISIDPAREAYFQGHDEELRQRFQDHAEKRTDGWHFPQYIRINVLTRE